MTPPAPPCTHLTVLLHEAVQAVLTRPDGVYVDGTFGRGGHSRALLQRLSPAARLIAFDKDPQALDFAAALGDARLHPVHASFAHMRTALQAQGVAAVHGVLLDLGVSSPQLDEAARGFSFRFDAPLDMRMDPTSGETAAQYLQRVDERELARVLREDGEERFAGPLARAIVARRDAGSPLRTTGELAQLAARVVRTREPGQDPATRTFQALRMAVNHELDDLRAGLAAAVDLLVPGGRLVVISFHSGEDRVVKQFIAHESREQVDRRVPFAPARALRLAAVARIRPSADEVAANPRARSALMRVAERLDAAAPAAPRGAR